MVKLCAIYNVWNDWDLLDYSVKNIEPLVEGVIIVASENSNWGEFSPIPNRWRDRVVIREPVFHHPMNSETDKRNFGLKIAREQGYTHFISMDADEFYEPEEFMKYKVDANMVCSSQVYFKKPTLTIGKDDTLVPFIHRLTPTIKHEFNKKYPYAWEGHKIRIDPTRSLNIISGVRLIDLTMHHFSHVRKDYEKKLRNSTARNNLHNSTILKDWLHSEEGYFCEFYRKRLYRVDDRFGLNELFC